VSCINPGCLLVLNCNYTDRTVRCVDGTCSLGSCGDSRTAPTGEQCDGGGESAACDADCTLLQCGDWTVNITAGESCDDGNTADGDGCSSACACDDTNDADGDGIGDACDDYVGSATPSLAILAFKGVGLDPAAESPTLANVAS
jgi:cysteine-rich repeat protein